MPDQDLPGDVLVLRQLRDHLWARLEDGQRKIAGARRMGYSVAALDRAMNKWVSLLVEYTEIEDALARRGYL